MEGTKKENTYIEELKKFIKKPVVVINDQGNTFEGICKAIDFHYVNIILMTDNEKIFVKNVRSITRQRDWRG